MLNCVLIPTDQPAFFVLGLEIPAKDLLHFADVVQRTVPLIETVEVVVENREVFCVLAEMFDLLVDEEIIEFVHVLQEPQVVMQAGGLATVLHQLADLQEVAVVDRVHVHVLASGLLS